jgi:dolichol-phosphate mannosyltransferase|tara:strand:- start:1079 stop:1777 length:699 start_codon:yes stop_codon:yes gene_type:complete
MKELTIIIPVYNEKKTILKIIDKIKNLKKLSKQIIVVDDYSIDGTREILLKNKNKIDLLLLHKKNQGKGAAIQTAQKHVKGKYVIIQDADLEYNPRDYFKLIKPIKEKKFMVVYGSRVLNKKRYGAKGFTSKARILGNHILTIFSNILNNQNLTDAHTCYKVFSSKVFNKIILKENGFEFCPEITTKVAKLNLKIEELPISYIGRTYNDGKKIKAIHALGALLSLVRYRFFR